VAERANPGLPESASMSSVLVQNLEYRCSRCFHPLYAAVDEAGTRKACSYCGTESTVPEATPDRVARAASVSPAALQPVAQPLLLRDEQMTDAQMLREVKRQMYVPPGEMQSLNGVAASRLKRFFGALIDGLLVAVAVGIGVVLVATLASQGYVDQRAMQSKEMNLDKLNAMAVMYFPALALALFQWNLISVSGQTIAKKLLGMRIVNCVGRSPGIFQGVILRNWVRNLLGLLPFFSLIDVLFIFGNSNRCLHDYIAGTYVVDVY
jgi:uncharacterized RDD family membrane protein YckC